MLLWVNVHGGFLLGFVLLGIYWLGAFWTWVATREARFEDSLQKIASGQRVRQLTWVGLLSIAASLINPYGWKLHAHVYSYLYEPFPDGSHRRIPVAQLPWHRTEMFSRATADHHRGSGCSRPQFETERDSAAAVRRVRRTVCFAEHSCFFDFAGSDCGAAVAFAQVPGVSCRE